jgi:hypothetical protein
MNHVQPAIDDVTAEYLLYGDVALHQHDFQDRHNVIELNQKQRLQAAGVLKQHKLIPSRSVQGTLRATEDIRSKSDAVISITQNGDVSVVQTDDNGNVNRILDTVDAMSDWVVSLER